MPFEYQKVKSAPKRVRTRGPALTKIILDTMKTCSLIVGDTLGPGGRPVLIERFEQGLPPIVTKDGVTVFRAMGFEGDEQVIMESARDCSIRTAVEAGDGTTTAIVLAEAIVRKTTEFCTANPRISPQRVVERLRKCWTEVLEPKINALSTKADLTTLEGRKMLRSVAKVSGNGDENLADAVMECFDKTGDEGNVTIVETGGHDSRYEVEAIPGYPVGTGYEGCAGKFAPEFINDAGSQRCWMPEPVFIVYNGKLLDMQTVFPLIKKIGEAWVDHSFNHNVVVVASEFSESVIAHFALNFQAPNGLKIFPLKAPNSPAATGQLDFLLDVAAVAGCELFNPNTRPLEGGELTDLGPFFEEDDGSLHVKGVEGYEASRFTSNILGTANEEMLLQRISDVRTQSENPVSELDGMLLKERLAKLSGGIARLKVVGNSNGETKERRDRAEDAVCAVRGALRHGVLPGAAWTLYRLWDEIVGVDDPVLSLVLAPALKEPFDRLLMNAGLDRDELDEIWNNYEVEEGWSNPLVYDASSHKMVHPFEVGLLDSTPAVREALKNAISIASLLGTLGGIICFKRDHELEKEEAAATGAFLRDANSNPADERAC